MKFTVVSAFPVLVAAIFAQTATAVVRPVKDCTNTDKWDVVVIGSGTAGSIVAAELATGSPDKCVLVLEAGKNSGQVLKEHDAEKLPQSQNGFFEKSWTTVHESPETAWNTPGTYDVLNCWGGECEYGWPDRRALTAKIVGGGSSINGALMQYPNLETWDAYPKGWKFEDMQPYLDKIEEKMGATSYPSADGKHYNDDKGSDIVKEAMLGIGFRESEDAAFFMPQAYTMGIPRVCAKNGRRTSPASEFLAPALDQTNIQLWTEAEAEKILLDASSTKATGLDIVLKGEKQTIKLADNGLVVISGGGIMTPEVLLNSDIGPGLKVDNDAVNKGLTDKIVSNAEFHVPGLKKYEISPPTQEHQDLYVEKQSGPLAQFGPLLAGFIDASLEDTEPGKKNTVEFFVGASQKDDEVTVHFVHFTPKKDLGGGTFNEDYTKRSFKKAMGIVAEAMGKKGYEQTNLPDKFPLNAMNHPAGTCEIGKCVDENTLLLKGGVTNIAVVDNSLLPEQAVVHSVFSLMAIALRAAGILNNFWGEVQIQNDEL